VECKPKLPLRTLIPFILISSLAHGLEVRTWTDVQSRKVEASLARVDGQNVTLKLAADGREIPYPLAKLSADDGKYVESVRGQLTAKPADANKPAAAGAEDVAKGFDAPWPEQVKFSEDPEVSTVEEDAVKKRFIYESASYRYTCDVRLSQSVVKGFAVMFEATHLYCRSLPLLLDGGNKPGTKNQILLFEKFSDYVAAGGPPSSGGVFMSGKGLVMVPLDKIGVKQVGSSYMLDRTKDSQTLSHELTHQVTPRCYYEKGADGWLTEGLAEYVAATPYRAGTYGVKTNQKAIFDYVTGYGRKDRKGFALSTKIVLPPLKEFMLQEYSNFTGSRGNINYGCGLLITNYFFHLDGEGDGKRVKAYLKAIHDGKNAEKSLDILLDGRTFEKLEEDVSKGWSRKGIDISFTADLTKQTQPRAKQNDPDEGDGE
jgi:SLA1 homology domain 1, SHD1